MEKITIDPWEGYTKEDLVRVVKHMEVRLAGMAERTAGLEGEINRRDKLVEDTIASAIRWLGKPNYHAQDADRMLQWLLDIEREFRPLIGVENKKYGLSDYCYRDDADPQLKKIAWILRDVINYFGWDDR